MSPSRVSRMIILFLCLSAIWSIPSLTKSTPASFGEVTLRPETLRAFNTYIEKTEVKNAASLSSGAFLWIDDLGKSARATAYTKLKRGEVLMQRIGASGANAEITGGMIHDWEGMIFIPGAKLTQVLDFLQDYNRQSIYFAPDVEKSKIEQHNENHFLVFLRFRRTKIVTVVLNTEHSIDYFSDSATRAHSRSSAVRIAEVEDPGEVTEKEKTPGKDSGFLWRMETWWRLEEKDGGVYLQNQVVSLTRDIPIGLVWAVEPFVTSIPRESLEFTLGAIRRAVLANPKTS